MHSDNVNHGRHRHAGAFVVEGILRFRMRFEFGPDGEPAAIVGIYEGGGEDRSPRAGAP